MLFFGKNLEYLREKEGLKQLEMPNFIGIERTTWNGYEKQKSFPKLEEFIRICLKFSISETDMLHTDLSKEGAKHLAVKYINEDWKDKYYKKVDECEELRKELLDIIKKQQPVAKLKLKAK